MPSKQQNGTQFVNKKLPKKHESCRSCSDWNT